MKSIVKNAPVCMMLIAGSWFLALTIGMSAQVKTTTSTTSGTASVHEVNVERGEVVYVSGDDLVVKMEDGTIRNFPNMSENARATVDGRPMGIHDLKPGMKLERTITVTKTPKVVTTVKEVTGKVWHVTPPNTVILTLEDGTNQQFTIPKDQKFNIDGQMTDAWGLKKGMKITATKVVEEPVDVYEHQHQITGSMPPPPLPPPVSEPILLAEATPPPTLAAPAAPAELPKTGSAVPLIGLLGALCLLSSLGLRIIRSTF
jgi:LPXTG-motif cell wall-anchored protein